MLHIFYYDTTIGISSVSQHLQEEDLSGVLPAPHTTHPHTTHPHPRPSVVTPD